MGHGHPTPSCPPKKEKIYLILFVPHGAIYTKNKAKGGIPFSDCIIG